MRGEGGEGRGGEGLGWVMDDVSEEYNGAGWMGFI